MNNDHRCPKSWTTGLFW